MINIDKKFRITFSNKKEINFRLLIALLENRLLRSYFNVIYNPLYDLMTSKRRLYHELHEICIHKLNFHNNERILCAGIGTGNEIIQILDKSNANIIGVDYSRTALRKATEKAHERGTEINTFEMDIRDLKFQNDYFDKVLCIHVMDFINGYEDATSELIRVLKPHGEFVITYPAEEENTKLAANLIKDSFKKNFYRESNIKRYFRAIIQILLSIIYIPLLLRSSKKRVTHASLVDMFTKIVSVEYQIQLFTEYNDFIVFGKK